MGTQIRLSSKGQIVIPKDVRDALGLKAGETLDVTREGRRIVLQAPAPARATIDYAEFRRRVPRQDGTPATIAGMDEAVDRMFAERGNP